MADCDAVTVVGNLLKQRVVLRGDTCTFLYLDGKSLVLDTYKYNPNPKLKHAMHIPWDKGKASCSNLQQSCSKVVAGVSTYNCRGRETKKDSFCLFFLS